jgi:hypothetical protein
VRGSSVKDDEGRMRKHVLKLVGNARLLDEVSGAEALGITPITSTWGSAL